MLEIQHWDSLPPIKLSAKVQTLFTDVIGKNSFLQFPSEALQQQLKEIQH